MSGSRPLTHADFAATIGDTYALALELEGGGEPVIALVLAEAVAPEGGDAGAAGTEPVQGFSLIFRGPADGVLPQGTYPLTHPELGEQLIFLVPIGRDGDGVSYEAVFA